MEDREHTHSGVSGINAGASIIFAVGRARRLGGRVPEPAPDPPKDFGRGNGLADGQEDKQ
jgi:hypothetical protein